MALVCLSVVVLCVIGGVRVGGGVVCWLVVFGGGGGGGVLVVVCVCVSN